MIGNCSGCHSLSRAGSRIGCSRCVGGMCNGEWVGFMRYNDQTQTWTEVVNADNKTIPGTYTTFAPVGNPFPDDTQSVAMVTSMTGTFSLIDPDTVFASADANESVDVSNSSIAMMSYSFANGQHVFGTPSVLVQQPITFNGQSYTNLFFPSFSPDGKLIVFNAARATWRNFQDAKSAGERLMIVQSGGTPIDLTNLNGGTGDHDITWPHWAPGDTSDYYWIVFSSERDYGHEVTAATSGQVDPSSPPVWLPGQDTRNDNISPYWTVPAGLF